MRHRLLPFLMVFADLLTVAVADQPASPPAPTRPAPQPPGSQPDGASERPGATAPDDDFFEFLGADDVGDAAWWEFLKRTGPPPGSSGGTQDGKP